MHSDYKIIRKLYCNRYLSYNIVDMPGEMYIINLLNRTLEL